MASGTNEYSAVYNNEIGSVPALVDSAGGLSPYGTMGQGGNVFEWNESAFDGSNSSSTNARVYRGGVWLYGGYYLRSVYRDFSDPTVEDDYIGFRVASVPEPSTYALLLMAGAGWLLWKRRKAAL